MNGGFFTQNKRLLVLGALGLLLSCCGFVGLLFGGINTTLKTSGAYGQAVGRAVADSRVQAALGAPVNPGWMVTGSVESDPNRSTARLKVPLEGSMRSGTLSIDAEKTSAEWHFTHLTVEVDHGASIDLLPK